MAARIGSLIGDRGEIFTLTEAECAKIRELCGVTQEMNGKLRFPATVPEISNPNIYT